MLASWIISHFPAHEIYVEPFGGAASVLMRKARSAGEIYNDLDDAIVNVFRVLRDPEQAARLHHLCELTPYARTELEAAYRPTKDPVEWARRVIFRAFAGHGQDSIHRRASGFRVLRSKESGGSGAEEWIHWTAMIPRFTERLQGVAIENQDAFQLIQQADRPGTLFYVDPPYPGRVRSNSVRYHHEFTEADHARLADLLHQVRGMVIISGYPASIYANLYAGWITATRSHYTVLGRSRVECLWLSPNIHTTLF